VSEQPNQPRVPASARFDDADDDDQLHVSGLDADQPLGRASHLPHLSSARLTPALRRVWRASGAVSLIALVAVAVALVAPHLPHLPAAHRQIPSIALQASDIEANCMAGSSWSRDGRQIAVVESNPCASVNPSATPPPNLLIFDAATGKRVAGYNLDPAVDAALARIGLSRSSGTGYDVSYYESNWSPNDALLAVGFGVYGAMGGDVGVAVVTLAGAQRGQVRALLEDLNDPSLTQPGDGFALIPTVRWDIADGTHSTIYLQPALAYRWLPSDVLVASEPLPARASAPAPSEPTTTSATAAIPRASDPRSFSMWQNGAVAPVTAAVCGSNGSTLGPLGAPYALLTLTASVWSPDGHYLLDSFIQARLPAAAGHPAQSGVGFIPCDNGPQPDQLPAAPYHDKALLAALRLLDAQGGNQLTLAWSPDGQRLAVATLDYAQNSGSLLIYDCASGEVIQNFSAADFEANVAGYSLAQNPVWSPDSHSLLLTIARPDARVVVLGPQALGG
jgi:hypothetical protein